MLITCRGCILRRLLKTASEAMKNEAGLACPEWRSDGGGWEHNGDPQGPGAGPDTTQHTGVLPGSVGCSFENLFGQKTVKGGGMVCQGRQ